MALEDTDVPAFGIITTKAGNARCVGNQVIVDQWNSRVLESFNGVVAHRASAGSAAHVFAYTVVAGVGWMRQFRQFLRPACAGAGKDDREFVSAAFAFVGVAERVEEFGGRFVRATVGISHDEDCSFHYEIELDRSV